MKDNFDEIGAKFGLEWNVKYAGGSMWRCKKCGSLANCIEGWFPCQNQFLPERIFCNECHNRWALKIEAVEGEMGAVTLH